MPITDIMRTWAVFTKDIKSEFRTRYAISAVLLFILTTITMILFGLSEESLNTGLSAGILWVVMFFSSMTGLSKSFVSEEERGTGLLLQVNVSSSAVYFGKLTFNIILSIFLNTFAAVLFLILVNKVNVRLPGVFAGTILTGSLGLAAATTIISAIIAKANTKNALFPVLSFPIVLPLILVGIETTRYAFEGAQGGAIMGNFQLILAYCGVLITVSYLLFDIVWKD